MPRRYYSNVANPTTITAGLNPGSTEIAVPATSGYPATPFTVALARGTASEEIVLVNGKTGSSFTGCVRGYDGTVASTHTVATTIEHVVSALDYTEASAHLYDAARDDHTQYLNTARHNALAHGEALLGNASVTNPKIADGAVGTSKMADSAVASVKIADGAVIEAKYGSNSIPATAFKDASIAGARLVAGAVGTTQIANSAVTDAKLASGISPSKIDSSIAGAGLVQSSGILAIGGSSSIQVNTDDIVVKTGGISDAMLALNSVTTTKILNDAVTPSKVSAGVFYNGMQSSGGQVTYGTVVPSGVGAVTGDVYLRYS